ncbi:unnamed protein product [Tuwongella immobilis]|uniref:Uncharacterized protein n=1 Tax=Tuwongella immobilis TaxID=692036 RepID=A0A6C2YW98_9BACT|nr:unnamed protein product [Tuwongella immobilis]VTS08698.1 unnamed protein product [Tuwongella immobilis]
MKRRLRAAFPQPNDGSLAGGGVRRGVWPVDQITVLSGMTVPRGMTTMPSRML